MPSLRNLKMTLIIYDHETNRVYADRNRHRVGESKPDRVNKLIVPKKSKRYSIQAEKDAELETVLVTAGTGSIHAFGHAHWLMDQKMATPQDIVEHFESFMQGNSQAMKHSKALVFTDKRIYELRLTSGEVVTYEYGEKRLFWGGGATTALNFDNIFVMTPMEIFRAVAKTTSDRVSADFTVVQGLPSKKGRKHDIMLHATAPWPDDIAQYEPESPIRFR